MCTLIVNWKPESSNFITVAANRDERPERPSEPFAIRDKLLCPLDVRGGTWIGVNRGLFVALTNLDTDMHKKNCFSRGELVLDSLNKFFFKKAVEYATSIDYRRYNAFNLVIASGDGLVSIMNNHESLNVNYLEPGLHISTGHGLDKWEVPRCAWVKNNYSDNLEDLKKILSYHDKDVDHSVCVHDEEESHKTRSSCIINGYQTALTNGSYTHKIFNYYEVNHIDQRPCDVHNEWQKEILGNG
jgi:uncharacterized protein with NRDE domain